MNVIKKLDLVYDSQHNNPSGQGYRECFSSACAMVVQYLGKIDHVNEYHAVRPRYGDSTDSFAQIQTIRHFGLHPHFETNGSQSWLKDKILAGLPIAVGWLHHGGPNNPYGGGHYSTVVGVTDTGFLHHDPNGEASLVNGGYTANYDGSNQHYSFKNWLPRWEVEGPGSGWAMEIRK